MKETSLRHDPMDPNCLISANAEKFGHISGPAPSVVLIDYEAERPDKAVETTIWTWTHGSIIVRGQAKATAQSIASIRAGQLAELEVHAELPVNEAFFYASYHRPSKVYQITNPSKARKWAMNRGASLLEKAIHDMNDRIVRAKQHLPTKVEVIVHKRPELKE